MKENNKLIKGIYAGFLIGILNAIVGLFLYILFINEILFYGSQNVVNPIMTIIFSIIIGKLLFGMVYGVLYSYSLSCFYKIIPASRVIYNNLIISLFYWLFFSIFIGGIIKKFYLFYYGFNIFIDSAISLILFLLFGLLYNYTYKKNLW